MKKHLCFVIFLVISNVFMQSRAKADLTENMILQASHIQGLEFPDCPVEGNATDSSVKANLAKGDAFVPVTAHIVITPREAAQKGLDYLIPAALSWQNTNNCFGCHVQTFAIVGGAIGKQNGFQVNETILNSLVSGMVNLVRGQKSDGCFARSASEINTTTQYALWAMGKYDELVSSNYRTPLNRAVDCLSGRRSNGGVIMERLEPPVDQGNIMATANFIIGTNRIYDVTGNTTYLSYMQQGANWLRSQSVSTTQDRVFMILGLKASGASDSDPLIQSMISSLKGYQRSDGGWGYTPGNNSYPYGTGQVLFALKSAGVSSTDPAIQNGIGYLLGHQQVDGSWLPEAWPGGRPSDFASTMWGVLGLLELSPPMTIEITSPPDGARFALGDDVSISVVASSNNQLPVDHIDLFIDGQKILTQLGSSLTFTWSTEGLSDERFYPIRAVAYNSNGETSFDENKVIVGNVVVTSFTASPNPFDPNLQSTTLQYELLFSGNLPGIVNMRIFNQQNNIIKTLLSNSQQQGGIRSVVWDGSKDGGGKVPYGHYLATIDALDINSNTSGSLSEQVIAAIRPADAATLKGVITEVDGVTPVADAKLRIMTATGEIHGVAITTSEGKYQISTLIPNQTYVMVISKQSYMTQKSSGFSVNAGQIYTRDMHLFTFYSFGNIALRSRTITDEGGENYLFEGDVELGGGADQIFDLTLGSSSAVEIAVNSMTLNVLNEGSVKLRALGTGFLIENIVSLSADPLAGTVQLDCDLHTAAEALVDIALGGSIGLDLNSHLLTGRARIDHEMFSGLSEMNIKWGYGTCGFVGFDWTGQLSFGPIMVIDGVAVLGLEMKSGIFKIGGELGLFKIDFAGVGYQVTSDDIDLGIKVARHMVGVSGVIAFNPKTLGFTLERDLSISATIIIPASSDNLTVTDKTIQHTANLSQSDTSSAIPIVLNPGVTLYGQEKFDDVNCNGIYDNGIDNFYANNEEYDFDLDGQWDEGTSIRLLDVNGRLEPYIYGKASIDLGLYYLINFQLAQAEVLYDHAKGVFRFSGATGLRLGELFTLDVVGGTLDLDFVKQKYMGTAYFRPIVIPGVTPIVPQFEASFDLDLSDNSNPKFSGSMMEKLNVFQFFDFLTAGQSFQLNESGLRINADLDILNTFNANAGFTLAGNEILDGVFNADFYLKGLNLAGTDSWFEIKSGCLRGEADAKVGKCKIARIDFEWCKGNILPDLDPQFGICIASPVDIHLYDALNRHTGKHPDGSIEMLIPGSIYQECVPCELEIISLSSWDLASGYRLALDGTGLGTFDLSLLIPDNDTHTGLIARFVDRNVKSTFTGEIGLKSGEPVTMDVDYDGDGIFEITSEPDSLIHFEFKDLNTPTIKEIYTRILSLSSISIRWVTSVPTTGNRVFYGFSTEYTDTSDTNLNSETDHEITLQGLTDDSIYHFRVVSTDSSGIQIKSLDLTFYTHGCTAISGDLNADYKLSITDVVYLANIVFKSWTIPEPTCLPDVNADGKLLLGDIVYLANHVMKFAPAPKSKDVCCMSPY